jgi:hypothetical protein
MLLEVYERRVVDPVDVLDRLGLLEHIDSYAGSHVPTPMSSSQSGQLRDLVDRLQGAPKRAFANSDRLAEATRIFERAACSVV